MPSMRYRVRTPMIVGGIEFKRGEVVKPYEGKNNCDSWEIPVDVSQRTEGSKQFVCYPSELLRRLPRGRKKKKE